MNKRSWLYIALLAFVMGTESACAGKGVTIGQKAPDFSLKDINGEKRSLNDFKGKYVVLEWTNYDCPFVKKHYTQGHMQALQKQITHDKDVVWLSICSSAKGKQGYYLPKKWRTKVKEKKAAPTTVLLDPAGKVGRLYNAKTTPHMFIIDPAGVLIYQGAIDDIRSVNPADINKAVNYVRQTLREAKSGNKVSVPRTKPYGCSVKYK